MAIIARYQRYLTPPASPSPYRSSKTSDLTELLPSNAHLRAPLPRTDSENRRQELAKQLAKDEEPISTTSSEGGGAGYFLAKAVVVKYMESYFPAMREHKVVLERGAEVVRERLRVHRGGRVGPTTDSALLSFARGVEVEWMVWSRITPLVVTMYAWWVAFAIWRKLDDGEHGFLVQFTTNKARIETWLTWAFAGLGVLLCVLAFAVWAVLEGMRTFSNPKSTSRENNEHTG